MTRSLQVFIILMVHTYFCILYLAFGIDSQKFAGGIIKFGFSAEEVHIILQLSLLSITAIILAFLTPVKIVFKANIINRKRVQAGFYVFTIPLISFLFYKSAASGFNYGTLATERHSYSFLVELRVIPYLLIIQHASQTYLRTSFWFKVLIFLSILVMIIYQARSIMLEIILIAMCIRLRKTDDKFSVKYYVIGFLMIPLSNVMIALRNQLSFEQYLNEMFKFEYLLIFNNIVAASLSVNYEDKLGWVIERFVLILPSPLRNLFGLSNPSDQMFLDVSSAASLTSGGFSYLANSYIIFGYYTFLVLYILYFIIEIVRRNYMIYKINNYIAHSYPILLSYVILAIRNDMGVLFKQIIQIILISTIMNMISRMRWKI